MLILFFILELFSLARREDSFLFFLSLFLSSPREDQSRGRRESRRGDADAGKRDRRRSKRRAVAREPRSAANTVAERPPTLLPLRTLIGRFTNYKAQRGTEHLRALAIASINMPTFARYRRRRSSA